jgi:hypothetical protein
MIELQISLLKGLNTAELLEINRRSLSQLSKAALFVPRRASGFIDASFTVL